MESIAVRNQIESILGAVRSGVNVTNYGLIGQYTYTNGFKTLASSVGYPIPSVDKVTGLELMLFFPDVVKSIPTANQLYVQENYRLSLVEHSGTNGYGAIQKLAMSGCFLDFKYSFLGVSPEIGNLPQWNCTFKQCMFRGTQ